MSNVKKNFIYNVAYQILVMILPLITAPYIARVLGTEGVGIYSYTYSVAYYFVLFAMLGINNYGNREIAKVKDNKEQLNKTFSSILLFHIILSVVTTIVYIVYCAFIANKNVDIAFLQSIYVLSAVFDINWFYFGMEKFKLTVIRNTIIKILSVIFMFMFVKNRNDLIIYTAIMASSHLISNILLWPFLKRYIKFKKVSVKDITKNIRPCLLLFIPVVAVSLYKIMDKIMLGNISTMSEVGLYENAEKMINIPLSIITALGTVMLPKMSNLIANGEEKRSKKYIEKSFDFVLFASSALCFGLIGIAQKFIPFYFGADFTKTATILQLLSITIIFISFANVIRTQYLIPNERNKSYIFSVILGAITNLILNFILIPNFKSIGASIATIFAEFSVMLYQIFDVRKDLEVYKSIKNGIKYIISGIIMCIFVVIVGKIINNPLVAVIIQIIVGAIVYMLTAGVIFYKANKNSLKLRR